MRSPFGHVFEREVIEAWFRDFGNRCPLTGEPLTIHQLTRDDKLRDEIRAWKKGDDGVNDEGDGAPSVAKAEEAAKPVAEQKAAQGDDLYDF